MSTRNTTQRKANGSKPKVRRSPNKLRKPIPETKVYVTKTEKDVLLGRGGKSNAHDGNKKYLDEVKLLAREYGNASKTDKTKTSEKVVQIVKQRLGGRFIQKEGDTDSPKWFIAHDHTARDKASQALREAYMKLQYQDSTDVGARQAAAYQAPKVIASEKELWGLYNFERGYIFEGIYFTTEGTGSLALGSSRRTSIQSIDGSYDDRDETNQVYDYYPYEGVVTISPDGHVYEDRKVAARRTPPRDEEDDDDCPFAPV